VLLLDLMMSFLCTVFSWVFPSCMLKFVFSLLFLSCYGVDNFLWTTTSQPYLLVTRVPECPQSFTSFLVIHFYFAYFPVWLFR
jgi:hypothetical protein